MNAIGEPFDRRLARGVSSANGIGTSVLEADIYEARRALPFHTTKSGIHGLFYQATGCFPAVTHSK